MPEPTLPTIHAVYATTSGNTELVVDTVADVWRKHGQTVETHRAERTGPDVITANSLFLFGASTWDHGTLNPFFFHLYEAMATINCSGKSAFFIGMGDNRYEPVLFNMGIQHVLDRWLKQGGKQLHHPLKINGDPHPFMADLILPWAEASAKVIEALQSSPTGTVPDGAVTSLPSTVPSSITRGATAMQEEV